MSADSQRPFPTNLFSNSPSALVVIDMQCDFLEDDAPVMADGGIAIVPGINRLLKAARHAGVRTCRALSLDR